MNNVSKKCLVWLSGSLLMGSTLGFARAVGDPSFSPVQEKAIQNIVHDYLVTNPKVLIEASRALQAKQTKAMEVYTQTAIAKHRKELFNSSSPVVGNQKGKITIVEFFDYQCVHCKEMAPVIQDAVKHDPEIRVVYKELPIFGARSQYAARAALAAGWQGKYEMLHNALMASREHLNQKTVLEIARASGLNIKRLQADMERRRVKRELASSMKLARDLRLMGTPAMVVGTTKGGPNAKQFFVPGVIKEAALQRLVQQANT